METKAQTEKEQQVFELLSSIDQNHLLADLDKATPEEREKFIDQVIHFEKIYPGGLINYHKNTLKCLADATSGVSIYEGYHPRVPKIVEILDFHSESIDEFEAIGLEEIKDTVFVLVAGGLGERLGYSGLKLSVPFELITEKTFLNYYIDFLMAYQKRAGPDAKITLCIMTSDDTHDGTIKLLEDNNYYGMPKEQISFMKQEKVPAILDSQGHFARKPNSFEIQTKPHGHGDVHTLIHSSGNSRRWIEEGKKWVCFFQDTNPLIFRCFPALIGVSRKHNLEVNVIGVPRKVGEAADVIVDFEKEGEKHKTFLIEWGYADVFFKPHGGEPVKPDGWSQYLTNINGFCFSLPEYHEHLAKTQGLVAEFINPKYEDETKTKFKSPARLETKSADYPRLLECHDRLGITQVPRLFSFTTCKNDPKEGAKKWSNGIPPECAGTCEYEYYQSNIEILRIAGVEVGKPEEANKTTFGGIEYNFGAKVVLGPDFGVTMREIRSKFTGTNKISAKTTLILDGDVHIENVELDSSVRIQSATRFEFRDLPVMDQNYVQFVAIDENETDPKLKMRGYKAINREDIIDIEY